MVTALGSLVRMKGLEPPRLAATDPKSVVSTNFTTSAEKESKDSNAMQGNNILWRKIEISPYLGQDR